MIELDDLDRNLLIALRSDCTQAIGALARELGVSQPVAWRRVKRLYDLGVIKARRVTVFLGIKLAAKGRVSLEDFERAVKAIPEVQIVEHVLGLYDYRLRVVARDISDFERILRRRVMTLPGVGDVEANVLLSEERRLGPLGQTDNVYTKVDRAIPLGAG